MAVNRKAETREETIAVMASKKIFLTTTKLQSATYLEGYDTQIVAWDLRWRLQSRIDASSTDFPPFTQS